MLPTMVALRQSHLGRWEAGHESTWNAAVTRWHMSVQLDHVAVPIPGDIGMYDIQTTLPGLVSPTSAGLDALMEFGPAGIEAILEEVRGRFVSYNHSIGVGLPWVLGRAATVAGTGAALPGGLDRAGSNATPMARATLRVGVRIRASVVVRFGIESASAASVGMMPGACHYCPAKLRSTLQYLPCGFSLIAKHHTHVLATPSVVAGAIFASVNADSCFVMAGSSRRWRTRRRPRDQEHSPFWNGRCAAEHGALSFGGIDMSWLLPRSHHRPTCYQRCRPARQAANAAQLEHTSALSAALGAGSNAPYQREVDADVG